MKCPNCGATIDVNDKECIYCGSKKNVQKKERLWAIFCAIIFAFIGVGVCVDLYKNMMFKNYPETTAYLTSYTEKKSSDDIEYNCQYTFIPNSWEYGPRDIAPGYPAEETTSVKPVEGSTKQIWYDPSNPKDYVFDVYSKITIDIIAIVCLTIVSIVMIKMGKDLIKAETEEQQIIEAKEAEEQEEEP